ncbi:MAG: helix-turn-helix transcriptional regulator, partial [Oscillospiraceae bacterium]|nr:helix-turn-helix transcriptional regulator [Oscillospiraceae bacterium]
MNEINVHIGSRIRNFRRMKKLTLQQLADLIHKSRATVSKYETGEIALDIETLYDISNALDVELNRITDYKPVKNVAPPVTDYSGRNPFFQADRLYFYFYDGRYHRLKDGVIDVHRNMDENGCFDASLSIHSVSPSGRVSEVYYSGKVLYSDTLIRFSFENQYNKLEQDLLYIFNPLDLRDFTEG